MTKQKKRYKEDYWLLNEVYPIISFGFSIDDIRDAYLDCYGVVVISVKRIEENDFDLYVDLYKKLVDTGKIKPLQPLYEKQK